MDFSTKDDYINVFQNYETDSFVTFDSANSYAAERSGDKSNVLIEYNLNYDPVNRIVIR